MDHQDIRTLKILEEIDKVEVPSQRHIARELNISLGLVNSFIKRLVSKGYFKATHIPANRVKYILTPKGAAEKTRLTYIYIKYSFDFYKTARQQLQSLFQSLSEQGVRRVVFYGAGDLAEIAYLSLQETDIQMVAVADDQQVGKKFLHATVKDIAVLDHGEYDKILITTVRRLPGDVSEQLVRAGVPKKKIVIMQWK